MSSGRIWAYLLAAVVVQLAAGGCGPSGRPELAPVTGTVNYDGAPLPQGRILFTPPGLRPAFGQIVDGKILRVTSHVPNDGAPVGHYSVGIVSYVPPVDAQSPAGPSLIPTRYVRPETSELMVTIEAGKTNVIHIELERQ